MYMQHLSKLALGAAAALLLFSCAKEANFTGKSEKSINFTASVGSYQTKATDTAFEKGDAVGLMCEVLGLDNAKLTWDGKALIPETEITWGDWDKNTSINFAAYYPYNAAFDWTFTIQSDQSEHAGFTASDFMGAVTAASPADGTVHFGFQHLLSKIVFTVDNQAGVEIADVYMSNVYGKVEVSVGADPKTLTDYRPGTVKAGKATVNGKEAWAVIIAPGKCAPAIKVVTTDGKEYSYEIESAIEFKSGNRYGAKIVIDEDSISTDLSGDITDWTDNAELEFGQHGHSDGKLHELDWNIAYLGCMFVDGYYSYGELELFNVSETDVTKYYITMLLDKDEEGDFAEILANYADEYFASLQESVDEAIAEEMESYDETLEEALYWLFNNEENDGPTLLFYGQPAGNYQFVVLSIDGSNGQLDKGYKIVNFSKDADPLAIYPWFEEYKLNEAWGAEWSEWVSGYEGKYYWIDGMAPGAAYVAVDSYTDDELDYYYGGSIADMYNYTASSVADYLANDWTIEELAYYGLVEPVAEDGSFESYVSTYEMIGLTNVYIYAFNEEGDILPYYGFGEIDVPEYIPEPIDWQERTDWAINYDPEVDTEYEDYPQAIVTTACDAEFFVTGLYKEGTLETYGLDAIGEDALYYVTNYGLETCLENGLAFDSVPVVEAWAGLYNGLEAFIFGIDENGKLTGEWHMEPLTGLEAPIEIEWVERTDWAVNYDANLVSGNADYPFVVAVTACDAQYFDVSIFSAGTIAEYGIEPVADYLGDWADVLEAYEYTMDDLVGYGAVGTPETLPFLTEWSGLENDLDIIILAYNENGEFTGEWHSEPLSGMPGGIDFSAPAKRPASISKVGNKAKVQSNNFMAVKSAAKFQSELPAAKQHKAFKADRKSLEHGAAKRPAKQAELKAINAKSHK